MYTAAMGFTSDACWFLLIKTLLIKNNKTREAAPKNEACGDEKRVVFFFLLGLTARCPIRQDSNNEQDVL